MHAVRIIILLTVLMIWRCGGEAAATHVVPTTPWTVASMQASNSRAAHCKASVEVTILGFIRVISWRSTFEIHTDGRGALHMRTLELEPAWLRQAKGSPSRQEITGHRFWFDDGILFPMRSVVWHTPDAYEERYDLRAAGDLVAWLEKSRYFKQETAVGAVTDVNGLRRITVVISM